MGYFKKEELKYIVYAGLFSFFWFVLALPVIIKTFDGNSPFFQLIVFNLGLYFFLVIFLKSMISKTSINLKNALGLTMLFAGLACIMPEYHVTLGGALVKGASLGTAAVDYSVGTFAINQGWTWTFNLLGNTISFVYIFTYLIAPILIFSAASIILKDFTKNL